MFGKSLVSRLLGETKTLTNFSQPARPYHAFAFGGKNGSDLKLTSCLPPDEKDLLARCGGDKKALDALAKRYAGNLNEVDAFLRKVEKGLAAYRIDAEGDVVMRVTKKAADLAAEHARKIHENSVY